MFSYRRGSELPAFLFLCLDNWTFTQGLQQESSRILPRQWQRLQGARVAIDVPTHKRMPGSPVCPA